ncbi:conserved hypothetical protein [Neospora caninum Liverpool]|uniref:Uncharacterized protein n=1 Tax=Neospora caninum (strain Liverpool) TaxID=572307 RepID=F0VPI5_NEOCL|nr:conserved hypothetical protein [Neospora caninum Liverpool]CBZ55631.1 conserved hypothetical protein [Neospora caninum Liverpool]CEL70373.1 TPA: hypothetical protein BN1204_060560 [Neospora caninum Liverpool]|eukprot:XP_003885659.1 conserved hypothetical protein [Neospora caninum Liverpool]
MWSIFAPEALTSTSEPASKSSAASNWVAADSCRSSVEGAAGAGSLKPGDAAPGETAPTAAHAKKTNGVGSRGSSGSSRGAGAAQAFAKSKPRRLQPQSRAGEDDAGGAGPGGRDEEEDWVEAQSKRLGKNQKASKQRPGQKQKDAIDEAQRILSAIWALTLAHPSAVPTSELTALFPPCCPLLAIGDAKESKVSVPKGNTTRTMAESDEAQPTQTGSSSEGLQAAGPAVAHDLPQGDRSSTAGNGRRGNGSQRKSGTAGRGGGNSGSVRLAYVQVKGQDTSAPTSAESASGRTAASRSEHEFDRSKGATRGNKSSKAASAGRDAGAGKVPSQQGRQQNARRGPGPKQGQYDSVIRNDKRGEAPRLRQQPVPQHQVSANGEDEDAIGDMIRRKLREAMTVEELQAAVHEARKVGLVFEAQLGEKKLMKMTGGCF